MKQFEYLRIQLEEYIRIKEAIEVATTINKEDVIKELQSDLQNEAYNLYNMLLGIED